MMRVTNDLYERVGVQEREIERIRVGVRGGGRSGHGEIDIIEGNRKSYRDRKIKRRKEREREGGRDIQTARQTETWTERGRERVCVCVFQTISVRI